MLKDHLTGLSAANYVEYGYGQVEPNHLSAQKTRQIYAQLPAAPEINVLENGQFVKYDYANGLVNFTGAGEWMLVFNEIKLYREEQVDCEFAMLKGNYNARIYSPLDYRTLNRDKQSRYYNGTYGNGKEVIAVADVTTNYDGYVYGKYALGMGTVTAYTYTPAGVGTAATLEDGEGNAYTDYNWTVDEDGNLEVGGLVIAGTAASEGTTVTFNIPKSIYAADRVIAPEDPREWNYTNDPFHIESYTKAQKMPAGTTMVPRVFKTNIGDIMTTNTIKETTLVVGDELHIGADGFLAKAAGDQKWQVVKVYTMPDGQKGVKVMRIA